QKWEVSAGDGFPEIGVDIIEAKVVTLKTCLEVICYGSSESSFKNLFFLDDYACSQWSNHLGSAVEHIDEIEPGYKKVIGKLLMKMWRDETVLTKWLKLKSDYPSLFTAEFELLNIQWFKDQAFLDSLLTGDRDWIDKKLQEPPELFRLAANILSRE
ncbi:hypothetical protein AJ79_02138, partial [Helicocarpus griseus UAMH5409]